VNESHTRKSIRLKDYDYSQNGVYYITLCIKNRREILGSLVGGDDHIAPQVALSKYGMIVKKYIEGIGLHYQGVVVDKYIIMPNHIHVIIILDKGVMWSSPPTNAAHAIIPEVIRSFKTLVTKEIGFSFWQKSYYDHIVRDEEDYLTKWNYIDTNPAKWTEDEYYSSSFNEAGTEPFIRWE